MSLLTAARSRNGEQRGLRREKSGSEKRGRKEIGKRRQVRRGNSGDGAERGWMETEMREQPNSKPDETGGGSGKGEDQRGELRR
jgi:hypothetical protein